MTSISTTTATTAVGLIINSVARGGAAANLASSSSVKSYPFQEIYKKWFYLSEISRFFVSGNIGNICFYLLEKTINHQLCNNASSLPTFVDEYKDTVSFFVGYILQIISQHALNAFLVYGLETVDTREKYIKTLIGQYSAYGFSLCGSTVLNLVLLRSGIDKTVAFFATMAVFAVVNYFVIGYIVRLAGESTSDDKKKDGPKQKKVITKPTAAAVKRFPRGGGGDSVSSREKTIHHRRSSLQNYCCFADIADGQIGIMEKVNRCHMVLPKQNLSPFIQEVKG